MIITVDIGNTNIVIGIFDRHRKLLNKWRFSSIPQTADEFYLKLLTALHNNNITLDAIDAVIISSVVPKLNRPIIIAFEELFRFKTLVVHRNPLKIDINLDLDIQIHQIGSDILANLVAAKKLYQQNLLIVDFGTATTICKINSQQMFSGAFIIPGINLFNSSLSTNTALPLLDFTNTDFKIGKNTNEALQIGAFHGYTGMIKQLLDKLKQEDTYPLKVIATGGNHTHFCNQQLFDFIEPDITLLGLRDIYLDNFTIIN